MTTNDYFLVASAIINATLLIMLFKSKMTLANKERSFELDSLRRSTWEQFDQILDRMDRMEKGCCDSKKGT